MNRKANFLRRNFTIEQARAMWAQIDAATALAFKSGNANPATMLTRTHPDGRLIPVYPVSGRPDVACAFR